ncbi:hypothetical protein KY360_00695 [Candidatus Woesearchaeota archaeon]|nr:hypothetical protein [Candidatus Woesearchaeota archaeon]
MKRTKRAKKRINLTVPEKFIKVDSCGNKLEQPIAKLYGLTGLKSIHRYQGHSCCNVHLLNFNNQKIIVKLQDYTEENAKKALQEYDLLNIFSDYVAFPKLLKTDKGLPYFKQKDKLIRVYEFIDGRKTRLIDNLDILTAFLKECTQKSDRISLLCGSDTNKDAILSEIKNKIRCASNTIEKFDKANHPIFLRLLNKRKKPIEECLKKEKIIPYLYLEPIKDKNLTYILESEHLGEVQSTMTMTLATYLADILAQSSGKLNISSMIKKVSTGLDYRLNEDKASLIRFFLLLEIVQRMSDSESNLLSIHDKYFIYYKQLLSSSHDVKNRGSKNKAHQPTL